VSRLDSFIRRLEAQRACLDRAARLVADIRGDILELGLGNGRTYDHLRELLPERRIFVCDRRLAAHPRCLPDPGSLLLGDMRETLPAARERLGGRIALAHFDAATGDVAASLQLAREVAPLLLPLLGPGAVLCSEPALALDGLDPLPLPEGIAAGRYHLYRRRV
jgi:S-adenosyl-L-methionine methyltransferase